MELGLFAQDAWKLQRLTLNLGLRYDYINMGFPAFDLPAGPYAPARHVDEVTHIPDWKDINPRVGAVYDVFGNGRTALKASIGRFNQLSRSDLTRRFHPFSSSIVTRKPQLDRQQQQLHSGLRPRELRRAGFERDGRRRLRRHQQPELRQVPAAGDAVRSDRSSRTIAISSGTSTPKSITSCSMACR